MLSRRKMIVLTLFFLFYFSGSKISVATQLISPRSDPLILIEYDKIIRAGYDAIGIDQRKNFIPTHQLVELERWYNQHPLIEYASFIGASLTIKFIDGSYIVILTCDLMRNDCSSKAAGDIFYESYGNEQDRTAVILNPAEYLYGPRQCKRIISILLGHDYSIDYRANQVVDLPFIRNNLSADIVYMNTHAGYFDVDGDHQPDAVVIATGELWTNDTEQKYAYDFQNKLIVKGMVADQGFVAFTPAFIEEYYSPGDFPNSLVFMATCYALFDLSMAQEFLDAGASVYMGWSRNTVFWTNSIASVHAIWLLSIGFTVHHVCVLIQFGGFYNWLFHSKLIYYGDGTHRIP